MLSYVFHFVFRHAIACLQSFDSSVGPFDAFTIIYSPVLTLPRTSLSRLFKAPFWVILLNAPVLAALSANLRTGLARNASSTTLQVDRKKRKGLWGSNGSDTAVCTSWTTISTIESICEGQFVLLARSVTAAGPHGPPLRQKERCRCRWICSTFTHLESITIH